MHQKQFYVGVDWASQSHHVCVLQAAGDRLGEQVFKHTGEGLARMAGWILKLAQSEPELVQVAIEVPHGPGVESLLNRGFQVHSINPRQLDRFRDRFSPAGAKDDSRDAHVLADALRTDPRCLRRLEPLDPLLVELREWSRIAEELTRLRTRLSHRLRDQLWRYYPQFLDLGSDLANNWMLALWAVVPTPDRARMVSKATIAKLLKTHRIRRLDAAGVLAHLRALASGDVVVYDRGYYSFQLLHAHAERRLQAVFRLQRNASALFGDFILGDRTDHTVTVTPSADALRQRPQAAFQTRACTSCWKSRTSHYWRDWKTQRKTDSVAPDHTCIPARSHCVKRPLRVTGTARHATVTMTTIPRIHARHLERPLLVIPSGNSTGIDGRNGALRIALDRASALFRSKAALSRRKQRCPARAEAIRYSPKSIYPNVLRVSMNGKALIAKRRCIVTNACTRFPSSC